MARPMRTRDSDTLCYFYLMLVYCFLFANLIYGQLEMSSREANKLCEFFFRTIKTSCVTTRHEQIIIVSITYTKILLRIKV